MQTQGLDAATATPPQPCGRFAPSPTGPLHAGSVLAALGSWLMARQAGGEWRVRIEDVDTTRSVPGAAQAQLKQLAALGLVGDGPVLYQTRRFAAYGRALARLLDTGHAFECHCSRAMLAATGGVHRTCVAGARRPDPAIRLRVPHACVIGFDDAVHGHVEQDLTREVGDFVLRRADGGYAYQLAVVVDDAQQGVSQVVRGADLLDSTPRQILLQRLLKVPTPAYLHLPLLLDGHGRKLSKSTGATATQEPLDALHAAWRHLGQPRFEGADTPGAWLEQALPRFNPRRIPRGPLNGAAHHAIATFPT